MIKIDTKKCDRCGTCVAACRFGALMVYEHFVEVDPKKCVDCNDCYYICPINVISTKKMQENTE